MQWKLLTRISIFKENLQISQPNLSFEEAVSDFYKNVQMLDPSIRPFSRSWKLRKPSIHKKLSIIRKLILYILKAWIWCLLMYVLPTLCLINYSNFFKFYFSYWTPSIETAEHEVVLKVLKNHVVHAHMHSNYI